MTDVILFRLVGFAKVLYKDITNLSTEQIENIKQLHLLLVAYNALQPGVFALSGWDLSGSLTLEKAKVSELIKDGDTRWINRGSYDLMNANPKATKSNYGIPTANNLYGSLPQQLKEETLFVMRLKHILKVREDYGIATSQQLEILDTSHTGLLDILHQLPKSQIQLSIINFASEEIDTALYSDHIPTNATVKDMFKSKIVAKTDKHGKLELSLKPHEYASLVFEQDANT